VLCNTHVKFDLFHQKAIAIGAEKIATGHYARVTRSDDTFELRKAVDLVKDQSYFLFELSQEQLSEALFPLGELTKPEVRDIAEEAGLSPGNLYYYFDSKDELLLFCQERTLEHMLAAVQAAGHLRASSAERLRAVLRAHVHALLDEMEGATAHLEVEALPEDLRRPVIDKRDRYERAMRALVAEGMKRGEFARGDAALVTRAMLGAVNWTARWYRRDGKLGVDEIGGALAQYLVKGLA
jgi:AcrR family transcriptional regulator